MKCTCGTRAPLAPFSNDKVAKEGPIIIGGARCPYCGQVYYADGTPVDMETMPMSCCGSKAAIK